MAKRRLTNKQERRIANKKRQLITEELSHPGTSRDHPSGTIISHHGRQVIVETKEGNPLPCKLRQNLGDIVCGDKVLYEIDENSDKEEGVVIAVGERSNILEKKGFGGKTKPMASNISKVVIVCAIDPPPNLFLIDRYIVAAANLPATPVIVLNKIDLLDGRENQIEKNLISVYQNLGYEVVSTSAKSLNGLDTLKKNLEGSTSILVGLSGVGKSSLVKALIPDLDIRIGQTSDATGEGKHTTTVSSLYHISENSHLIDSPGVRDFTPNRCNKDEILRGFIEINKLDACKFSNCAHTKEKGCSIISAYEKGTIASSRYESFNKLFSESPD